MNAILSIVILLVVVVLMFFDKIPMTTVALTGAIVCCALGMYEFKDIFSDLGSSTIVLMFGLSIIGMAMFKSGLASALAEFILRFTGKSERGILSGILVVSAVLSAFSSNTAVVLMMIPLVKSISEESDISLKRTMYPLGVGAAMGGAITLVGTTSNVAGNQVLENAGLTPIGFWSLAWVGLPIALVSFVYMITLGRRTLPNAEGHYDGPHIEKVTQAEGFNKGKMILTAVICVLAFAAMMISSSLLFVASLVGAVLLILTGCISEKDAFASLDWKLFLLIVSFGVISSSITNSGGGELIANTFVNVVGKNASPSVVCAALFLLTAVLTNFMSNVVATVMMGPIAIHIASGLGVNPTTMVIVVIIAANACFATPLGSPYFTMLMPEAKYKFSDYVRMGLPLMLINFVLSVLIIPLVWAF